MKIFGFWHIYTINNWREIVKEQKNKIKKSKLGENSEAIFVNVAGDVKKDLDCMPNVTINHQKEILGELPLINFLHNFCSNEKECLVWYIHAKGVTRPENKCVSDWRHCLEYFNISKWQMCVQYLEEYDLVGSLWRKNHFCGNFWWAKSSYIKNCQSVTMNPERRHQAEFFVGTANPKVKNLHETNINHYKNRYGFGNFVKIF